MKMIGRIPQPLRAVVLWFLRRLWFVQADMNMTVALPPAMIVHTLHSMIKPNIRNLELGNLFAQGRRYNLSLRAQGFRLTTTYKSLINRRRTQSSVVIWGDFTQVDDRTTRIQLYGRMEFFYLLNILPLPLFMTSIIIYMPWAREVIVSMIILLFGLSWAGHRYHAAYEAQTVAYFVQRALEAHIAQPQLLASPTAHIIYETQRGFSQAWDRFFQEKQAQESHHPS